MPDLLIVTTNHRLRAKVEEIAHRKNFRIKSALDVSGALEWIKNWNFDIVCIDPLLSVRDQEQIADKLWRENPIAPFVIVDFSEGATPGDKVEQRLFGVDVVKGPQAVQILEKFLDAVPAKGAMNLQDFSIMVVEDLDSPRDIICAFVESMGFGKVIGYRSAKEALAQLIAEPESYSCIITDIKMPEFSGQYLIEQVRLHIKLQHLPIIVLTAYGSADTLLACLTAGASGFLVKPPKRNDLARELGRAYRIATRGASPRLASPDEVDQVRAALEKQGFS